MKKIETFDVDLIKDLTEENYNKARCEYIAEYKKYVKGYSLGFWGGWKDGEEVKDPIQGEAEWNNMYPKGLQSWAIYNGNKLTACGQQRLINKLNEVITYLNTETPSKKKG